MRSIIVLVLAAVLTYGVYLVTKTVSYKIFYEDMVENTVVTLVKPQCLVGNEK